MGEDGADRVGAGSPSGRGSPSLAFDSVHGKRCPRESLTLGPRRLSNVLCHVRNGALPEPLLSSFQLIFHYHRGGPWILARPVLGQMAQFMYVGGFICILSVEAF